MRKFGWAVAATALLAAGPAPAAEARLPTEPWPRAVACLSHLSVIITTIEAEGVETKGGQDGLALMDAAITSWFLHAQVLPDYTAERVDRDVDDYVAGPLGSGPEALDSPTRLANLEVCVNEAIDREAALEAKAGKD